jgi:hypothetical protein
MFRAYRPWETDDMGLKFSIETYEDVRQLLSGPNVRLFDEYGKEQHKGSFFSFVESKADGEKHLYDHERDWVDPSGLCTFHLNEFC